MTLSISIPKDAEERLRSRAAACGQDVSSYVTKLVTHFAEPPTPLEQLSGPIYERFLETGMSDDDLGELLEKSKHEMRAERHSGQQHKP